MSNEQVNVSSKSKTRRAPVRSYEVGKIAKSLCAISKRAWEHPCAEFFSRSRNTVGLYAKKRSPISPKLADEIKMVEEMREWKRWIDEVAAARTSVNARPDMEENSIEH